MEAEAPKSVDVAADLQKQLDASNRTDALQKAEQAMKDTRPTAEMIQQLDAKIDDQNLGDRGKTTITAEDVKTASEAATKKIGDAYDAALKKVGLDKTDDNSTEKKPFIDWKKETIAKNERNTKWYQDKLIEIEKARKDAEIKSAQEALRKAKAALLDAEEEARKAVEDVAKTRQAAEDAKKEFEQPDNPDIFLFAKKSAADIAAQVAPLAAQQAVDNLKAQQGKFTEATSQLAKVDGTKAESEKKVVKDLVQAGGDALTKVGDFLGEVKDKVQSGVDFVGDKVVNLGQQAEKMLYDAKVVQQIVGKAIAEIDKGMSREDVAKFITDYNIAPGVPALDAKRVQEIKNTAKNNPELNARLKLQEDAKNAFHDKYVGKDGKVDFKGDKAAEQNTTLADLFPYAKAITINGTLAFALKEEFYFASGERARVKNGDLVKPWTDSNSPEYWKGYFALRNTPYKSEDDALKDKSVVELENGDLAPAEGRAWCPGNPVGPGNYATVLESDFPPTKTRDEALADNSIVREAGGDYHSALGLIFVDSDRESTNFATLKTKVDAVAVKKELLPKLTVLSGRFTEAKFSPADSDDLSKATNKRSDLMRDFYQIERKFEALGGESKESSVARNIFGNVKSIYEKTLPLLDAKIVALTKAEEDKKKAQEKPKAAPEYIAKKEKEVQDLGTQYEIASKTFRENPSEATKKAAADASEKLLVAQRDLQKMQPGGDVARAEGADGKAADAKKVAKAKKKPKEETPVQERKEAIAKFTGEANGIIDQFEKALASAGDLQSNDPDHIRNDDNKILAAYKQISSLAGHMTFLVSTYREVLTATGSFSLETKKGSLPIDVDTKFTAASLAKSFGAIDKYDSLVSQTGKVKELFAKNALGWINILNNQNNTAGLKRLEKTSRTLVHIFPDYRTKHTELMNAIKASSAPVTADNSDNTATA